MICSRTMYGGPEGWLYPAEVLLAKYALELFVNGGGAGDDLLLYTPLTKRMESPFPVWGKPCLT